MQRPYDGSEELLGLMYRSLEHGLRAMSDGMLLPVAVVVADGQRGFTRFLAHPYTEAVAAARQHVVGSSHAIDRWAVIFEGIAHFPDGRAEVVVVEGGEVGAEHGHRLVQRYERAGEDGVLRLIGVPELVGRATQLLDRAVGDA